MFWRDGKRRICLHCAFVSGIPDEEVNDDAESTSEEDGEEHETGYARIEMVANREYYRVGLKEKIDASVNKLWGLDQRFCSDAGQCIFKTYTHVDRDC